MKPNLDAMFHEMSKMLDFWHRRGDKLFPIVESDMLPAHIRLVRANYHIWHCIEQYCEPDTNRVLYVYDQGLEHNKLRADARMEMDQTFVGYQGGVDFDSDYLPLYNSETLASIMDRWSNAYIKHMHLEDGPKKNSVWGDCQFLKSAAYQLWSDMQTNRRWIRVNVAESIKIEYPHEASTIQKPKCGYRNHHVSCECNGEGGDR